MLTSISKRLSFFLLLAILNSRIQEILVEFIVKETNNHIPALNFKKAIGCLIILTSLGVKRIIPISLEKTQISFFALFGDEFKKQVEERLRQSEDLTVDEQRS